MKEAEKSVKNDRRKAKMAGASGVPEGTKVTSADGVPCKVLATGLPPGQPSYVLMPEKCGRLLSDGKRCERNVTHEGLCNGPLVATDHPLPTTPAAPLRLDLGCGGNKRQPHPGEAPWVGVDVIAFPGVDVVCDLTRHWPWEDNSVDEAHASHVVEHFDAMRRVHFVNELYRVLRPGAKATLVCPHWASCRAYGDPTHQWPPVSEFWFYYLLRAWRLGAPAGGTVANAPHTDATYLPGGFACDFDATWGYALHPQTQLKAPEAQQFQAQFYKEAIQDIVVTLTKRA